MKLIYKNSFKKSYRNLDKKIQTKTDQALFLFTQDPFSRILHNHQLYGSLQWCRSINVTWDFRIIFCEVSYGMYEIVEVLDIGTHSQLYW